MFHQSSEKMPVTFKYVTACFSEEEWKLLHEREKLFYIGVMQKIHQALITMGYCILNPEMLLQVITWRVVRQGDRMNPKSRTDLHDPTSSNDRAVVPTPGIFLRIQEKEEQSYRDLQSSEETEIGTVPMTGPLMATPEVSLQIKEEGERSSMGSEGREALACDPAHQSFHPETLLHINKWEDSAHVDAQDLKSQADLTETISSHHPAISTPSEVVLRIQQKQEQCGRDAASPEEEKMINSLCTGPFMATPDVSLQIKEEEKPGSMDSEGREALACDPAHHTAISPPPEVVLRIQKEEEQCGRDAASPEEGKMINSPGTESGILVKTKCLQTNQRLFNFQKEKWDLIDEEHEQSTELIKKCVHLQNNHISCTSLECEKYPIDNTRSRPLMSPEYKKTVSDLSALQMHHRIHAGEKPFKCTECEKHFTYLSDLKGHQRVHAGEKPHECTDCRKSFSNSSALKRHQRIHTGERPFRCTECDKGFFKISALKVHESIHKGEKLFECRECKKCFRYSSYLKVHQRTHTGEKPYECTRCKKVFTRLSAMKNHQRIHTAEKPYLCSECDKSFSDSSALIRHQKIHARERPFRCTECEKGFFSISALKVHERIHTGEKPYECSECEKSFRDPSTLKMHCRIHTEGKLFECRECKKCFRRSSYLKVHQRIHTGEKPYKCSECEKSFRNPANLKMHYRIHTEEKLFECRECKKCFRHSSYLKVHQRIHTGEKPYKCTRCKNVFSDLSAMKKHQRIHTGEKPFECRDCKKCFRHSSYLKVHQRIHTGEKPYECTRCKKLFTKLSAMKQHQRFHTEEKPYTF